MKDYVFKLNISNNPISINGTTTAGEADNIPVVMDSGLRSVLEKKLGHPFTTLSDWAECVNRGIIKSLDPKTARKIRDACANWDYDGDDDGWTFF